MPGPIGFSTLPARDTGGFFLRPETWTEDVAIHLAGEDGISLEDAHWQVIHYVRHFWLFIGRTPSVMDLCRGLGLNVRTLFRLFPGHPLRTVCRLAGLPPQKGLGYLGCGADF